MKQTSVILFALLMLQSACKKQAPVSPNDPASPVEDTQLAGKGGGSGSGGGGNGNGNNTGLLQSVLSGNASRLISGATDSIWVTFTQPAPAGGWTLNLSSSNPAAVQVPATVFVPAGQTVVHPIVTGGQVSNATNVTITVRLNSQTKTTVLRVFPLTATFPAPQLQSPGNGASFRSRTIISFQWNANNNAYYYHLQIANNPAFTNPETNLFLNDPIWPQSSFSGFTNYWRVRYISADGTAGPWSSVRNFSIQPQ